MVCLSTNRVRTGIGVIGVASGAVGVSSSPLDLTLNLDRILGADPLLTKASGLEVEMITFLEKDGDPDALIEIGENRKFELEAEFQRNSRQRI